MRYFLKPDRALNSSSVALKDRVHAHGLWSTARMSDNAKVLLFLYTVDPAAGAPECGTACSFLGSL